MKYAKLIGTGSFLPANIRTNDDIAKMVDTSDEWITTRTGIQQRHIASANETNVTMADIASRRALEKAGIAATEIDLIIVATVTGERIFPSTACLLQKSLGVSGIPAFDVNAACAGFNYALAVANNFIRAGQAKTVLIVGSEVMSRVINWQDRSTCILFGDGAGAMIFTASDEPGILSTHIFADGQGEQHLYVPNVQCGKQTDDINDTPYMVMSGNDVYKFAVKNLGEVIGTTLAANNITSDEVDWLIPHQANLRIIKSMAKKFNMSMSKVIVTIDRHGNTSGASIPLALDDAISSGKIKPGCHILLESFGGGFTWGSALLRY